MVLKKVNSAPIEDKEVPVVVEPLSGHSDSEVISALEQNGASQIRTLSPGFISAQVKQSCVRALETQAHVHLKAFKQMHEG